MKIFNQRRRERETNTTILNSERSKPDYWNIDRDKDGVPDYLQKKRELKSLVEDVADSNLAEIDSQKEIEALEMKWRGFRYSFENRAFVKWSNGTMTEEGIKDLGSILATHVNKHSQTTSLSEEYVHKEILDTMKIVNGLLKNKQKNWKISYSDLDPISKEIEALIFYSLCKSIGDGQRSHITQRVKITETKQTGGQQQISV